MKKMYALPYVEVMGKQPVRLVEATPAIWSVERTPATPTWWVFVESVDGAGNYFSLYSSDLTFSGFTVTSGRSLVDLTFFLVMWRRPMVVGIDFGRCLAIILEVRPGHVANQPLLMVQIHIFGGMHPAHA